jgi:hypothetical protein
MAERIVNGTDLNIVDNLMFSAPKATAQGAKSVNILNKKTKTIFVMTAPLMLTWGATDYKAEGEEKGNGKFELSLQFPGEEYKTEDTDKFLENVKAVELLIKTSALTYSKEWLGKQIKSAEVIDALCTPMLKYPKDKQTGDYDYSKPPTLRVKLPQWEGVWKSELYDEEGQKLFPSTTNPSLTPLDLLKKGSNIMCLIQFGGIWLINGKISANWKLVQAVVQKPRDQLQGQCFIKIKQQDKDKLVKQAVVEDVVDCTTVDDSDEEQEDDEEEQQEIAVAPVVIPVVQEKKKLVKKQMKIAE